MALPSTSAHLRVACGRTWSSPPPMRKSSPPHATKAWPGLLGAAPTVCAAAHGSKTKPASATASAGDPRTSERPPAGTVTLAASSGSVDLQQLAGAHAEVLLPLQINKTGKIRLLVDGQHVDLFARTKCDELIERKANVLVVDITDGMSNVTTLPEDYTEPTKE